MTPAFVLAHTIPAAMALLPPKMNTAEARAMLIAIGLQESRFEHRRQTGGPARGYWQFEQGGGVVGVITHQATNGHALKVCSALDYTPGTHVYHALEDNDVLACAFARLLLWTLPHELPTTADDGWHQYLLAWRPGKPHPETWAGNWIRAWETMRGSAL